VVAEVAAMSDALPKWLPEFPCWTYNDDGERVHHGGDYTLAELLDFLSGYDPTLSVPLDTAPGPFGDDVEWTEYPFPVYSEHDVIRALVAEVRRLRTAREAA
jgi:hypothetical protein